MLRAKKQHYQNVYANGEKPKLMDHKRKYKEETEYEEKLSQQQLSRVTL